MYTLTLIYDRSQKDSIVRASLIENWLSEPRNRDVLKTQKPRHVDIHEPLTQTDIAIHIDTPVYSAIPWAFSNVLVKNPEKWSSVYATYEPAYDAVISISVSESFDGLNGIKIALATIPLRKPQHGNHACPPILDISQCPPISVITPTYNRRKLLQIAFHNLMATDYPRDKIEWVVVEDNENQENMASDMILGFQVNNPSVKFKYIPLSGRHSIGYKRNIGVEHASNDIILFMDDDDHYPVTSFRRRVAWLTKSIRKNINIACCTTIAMYNLQTGQSAVNVPPWDIALSKRVSEATLTFFKSAWVMRKFPDKSESEGDDWIDGRELSVIEIPPQQIIVAFNHGENDKRRKIPETAPVGCFWNFPKEYLQFIHGLVGVEIVEEKQKKRGK